MTAGNQDRGQGTIEYILMIAGIAIVAVAIVVIVMNASGNTKQAISGSDYENELYCQNFLSQPDCTDTASEYLGRTPGNVCEWRVLGPYDERCLPISP